jgi:hypothetical protein
VPFLENEKNRVQEKMDFESVEGLQSLSNEVVCSNKKDEDT